jgi:hypothetical protein
MKNPEPSYLAFAEAIRVQIKQIFDAPPDASTLQWQILHLVDQLADCGRTSIRLAGPSIMVPQGLDRDGIIKFMDDISKASEPATITDAQIDQILLESGTTGEKQVWFQRPEARKAVKKAFTLGQQ